MNYRDSLSFKMVLILLVCTINVTALMGLISYNIEKKELIKNLEERAEQIVERISYSLSWPMWEYMDAQVRELILLELKNDIIAGIIVKEKNGSFYKGMANESGSAVKDLKPEDKLNDYFIKLSREIKKGGSLTLGTVELYVTDVPLKRLITDLVRATITQVIIMSVVIIMAIFISFKKIIIRPLEVVFNTVNRVANGDLAIPRSHANTDDEIGRFINALDKMVESLRTAEAKRNEAEKKKEVLMSELSRKTKEMENVVYITSHDLRAPLINIQGFSQCLKEQCGDLMNIIEKTEGAEKISAAIASLTGEQIPHSLEFINAGVKKIDALLGGLLRLSRTGRAVLRKENLDINLMIKNITAAMNFQIQQKGVSIETGDLPECFGDGGQINQVFSNFIDNAIKYRDAERPLRITINGSAAENEVTYVIEDNGIGISPENHEKIWELFQRLDPKGPIIGEGMGLTLIRRIVSKHEGRTWVESTPGKGSRFFVVLPAAVA